MKRIIIVFGLLLVILIAGSACHRNNRRRMGDFPGMTQNFGMHRGMHGMGHMFQGRRFGMLGHMGMMSGMDHGMMRGMHPGMGYGMGMPMDSTGWMPMGMGRQILQSIPNVTEDQKKQIEELNRKQMDEIKKLREEMSDKMKTLIASHKTDVLNVLTPEQKKYVEDKKELKR
jgi:hypothetical protein